MEEIPISKFKATCLAVVERVRRTRKPIRITKHGEPVAQLIPEEPKERRLGAMAGRGVILGDIVSPASDEEDWEALR